MRAAPLLAALFMLAGCGAAPAPLAASRAPSAAAALGLSPERLAAFDVDLDAIDLAQEDAPTSEEPPTGETLPTKVDNRAFCSPVVNQGMIGSCVSVSIVKGLREYLQRRRGEPEVPLSALFAYYQLRHPGPELPEAFRFTMDHGMAVLRVDGAPPESDWRYAMIWNPIKKLLKPPAIAYEHAKANAIATGRKLETFGEVKAAIAHGQPVVFAFVLYASQVPALTLPGLSHIPAPRKHDVGIGAAHAMMAVGYDDRTGEVLCKNSWGAWDGDHGYRWLPYEVLRNRKHSADFWTAE